MAPFRSSLLAALPAARALAAVWTGRSQADIEQGKAPTGGSRERSQFCSETPAFQGW